ncbi:hypothetical protein, partial [Vibrio vulnificus]|uniref:hypothetical protein n=1 Tax=Vibrio vulnificus TaxID=672 RepID=UPI0019D49ED6
KELRASKQRETVSRLLARAYNEKGHFEVQHLNQVNIRGRREKRLLVVASKALYILDAMSFAAIQRIPYDRIAQICCSSM